MRVCHEGVSTCLWNCGEKRTLKKDMCRALRVDFCEGICGSRNDSATICTLQCVYSGNWFACR